MHRSENDLNVTNCRFTKMFCSYYILFTFWKYFSTFVTTDASSFLQCRTACNCVDSHWSTRHFACRTTPGNISSLVKLIPFTDRLKKKKQAMFFRAQFIVTFLPHSCRDKPFYISRAHAGKCGSRRGANVGGHPILINPLNIRHHK